MKTIVCIFLTTCTLSGGAFAESGDASDARTVSTSKSTKSSTVSGDLSSIDTLRWMP